MLTRKYALIGVLVLLAAMFVSSLFSPVKYDQYVKNITALTGVVIALKGLLSELGIHISNKEEYVGPKPSIEPRPFRLTPSFKSGVYGGLIGGTVAGFIIGLLDRGGTGVLVVVPYAALLGSVIGACTQYLILLFRYLVTEKHYPALVFNEVTGGFLGGGIAGSVIGALGGWYFNQEAEPISTNLIIWGSAIGPIFVVFGALLYDYHGRLRNVMRAFLVSLVIIPIAAVIGIYVFQTYGINPDWFYKQGETLTSAIQAGVWIGSGVGMILGFQIGLALLLYRKLEIPTALEEQ